MYIKTSTVKCIGLYYIHFVLTSQLLSPYIFSFRIISKGKMYLNIQDLLINWWKYRILKKIFFLWLILCMVYQHILIGSWTRNVLLYMILNNSEQPCKYLDQNGCERGVYNVHLSFLWEQLTTSTLYSSCETLQACQLACWLFLWVLNDKNDSLKSKALTKTARSSMKRAVDIRGPRKFRSFSPFSTTISPKCNSNQI